MKKVKDKICDDKVIILVRILKKLLEIEYELTMDNAILFAATVCHYWISLCENKDKAITAYNLAKLCLRLEQVNTRLKASKVGEVILAAWKKLMDAVGEETISGCCAVFKKNGLY